MDRPTAESLFERHHLRLYRFLLRMTGEGGPAEDLLQEVFVRVLRGLETYHPRERDQAWLFRIARRLVADRRKERSREPALIRGEEKDLPTSPPLQVLALSVDQALALLPAADREAFLLREQGGFGYAEIAAIAGGTEDAVRNRIHRARTTLRRLLAASALRPARKDSKEASP
jgi:RNA polymerase sigma-70 factor, ECF subfamily